MMYTVSPPTAGYRWQHMVTGVHDGADTTDTVDWSIQGQTILTDITDPQPSGTNNITSAVQFIPHQCNTCVL